MKAGQGVPACEGALSLCERVGDTRAPKCQCLQGVCGQGGRCKCNVDWYGQWCDVSPIRQAYHIPGRLPEHVHPSITEESGADGVPVGVSIVKALDALQHPAPGSAMLRVVKGETKGLGAWVHHVAGALTQGVKVITSTTYKIALLHSRLVDCPADALTLWSSGRNNDSAPASLRLLSAWWMSTKGLWGP